MTCSSRRFGVIFACTSAVALLSHQSAAIANIPAPANFHPYCSWALSAGTKRWAFDKNASDPCPAGPDSGIRAAGYYDTVGYNRTYARCGPDWNTLSTVFLYHGPGVAPINSTLSSMNGSGQPYCELKVIPDETPIFVPPFAAYPVSLLHPLPAGFPFLHTVWNPALPYNQWGATIPLNVEAGFGQLGNTGYVDGGGTCAALSRELSCVSDYKGHDLGYKQGFYLSGQDHDYSNIEQAEDMLLAEGSALRAMADGQILSVRDLYTPGCYTAAGGNYIEKLFQKEIYILYKVGSGRYTEQFISYYAHVQDWEDSAGAEKQDGDFVSQGATVGHVGKTGCTGGTGAPQPHLHYAIYRITNAAQANNTYQPWIYAYDVTPNRYGPSVPSLFGTPLWQQGSNLITPVDPFGWQSPSGSDPNGWGYYGVTLTGAGYHGGNLVGPGAASSNLWISQRGYPRPCDDDANGWSVSGAGTQYNPYRSCY